MKSRLPKLKKTTRCFPRRRKTNHQLLLLQLRVVLERSVVLLLLPRSRFLLDGVSLLGTCLVVLVRAQLPLMEGVLPEGQ